MVINDTDNDFCEPEGRFCSRNVPCRDRIVSGIYIQSIQTCHTSQHALRFLTMSIVNVENLDQLRGVVCYQYRTSIHHTISSSFDGFYPSILQKMINIILMNISYRMLPISQTLLKDTYLVPVLLQGGIFLC